MAYIPLYTTQIFTSNFLNFISWKNLKANGMLVFKKSFGITLHGKTLHLRRSIFQPRNESIGSMLPKHAHNLS